MLSFQETRRQMENENKGFYFDTHVALITALESLTDDPLASAGTNICIYRGNPQGDLMIIGEGPGAEEDVGRHSCYSRQIR